MSTPEGKSAAPRVPSYIEFEPFCQWQREEGRDVLVLHLPEFKKEQLKVQINSRGILKISGQRSIDTWKRSKFYKEVEVPKNCDANGIQAKFANGCLYVIMPKAPTPPPTEETKALEVDGSGTDQKKTEATQAPAETPAPAKDKETEGSIKEKMQPAAPDVASADGGKLPKDVRKPKPPVTRMKTCAKTSLNVAVAVAVLAALGAYVSYMYRSVVLED